MKILIVNILSFFILTTTVFALRNTQSDSTETKSKSKIISIDSLGNAPKSIVEKKDSDTKYIMSKSPTKAVIYSLILPGMGQLYVESYWKVPLFVGACGTLVYLIIDNNKKFNNLEKEWKALDDSDPNKSRLKLEKEFYRDLRDKDAFYLFGVYIISAIDAYVGAHLYDFNVSDNLSFNISPDLNQGVLLQMTYKW